MIPATGSYVACYRDDDGSRAPSRKVEAWAHDGHPMVFSPKGLIRAEDGGNFRYVMEGDAPVVGVMPGNGWLIHCTDSEGVSWVDPVLGWAVHADGVVHPLVSDSDGVVDDPSDADSYRIYHPDSIETTESARPFRWDPNCIQCCGTSMVPDGDTNKSKRCDCYNASPGAVNPPPRGPGLPAWYRKGKATGGARPEQAPTTPNS
jgi:hypothetical protein